MNSIGHVLPSGKYVVLSLHREKDTIIIRTSDDKKENLSCPLEEMFIAYLEFSHTGVHIFSSAEFRERDYQRGLADGLMLAADKIQALLEQNGIS